MCAVSFTRQRDGRRHSRSFEKRCAIGELELTADQEQRATKSCADSMQSALG